MPIIPGERLSSHAKKISDIEKNSTSTNQSERSVIKYLRSNGMEHLGSGAENHVLDVNPHFKEWWEVWKKKQEKGEVVFAVDYANKDSAEKNISRFYVNRLLNILFPHNFPKIYATFVVPPNSNDIVGGTVRQSVYKSEDKNQIIAYPISEVEKVIKMLNLPIVGFDDGSQDNFILSDDGGEYYVDKLFFYGDGYSWNENRLKKYMQKNNFSEHDISRVHKIIDRLKKHL